MGVGKERILSAAGFRATEGASQCWASFQAQTPLASAMAGTIQGCTWAKTPQIDSWPEGCWRLQWGCGVMGDCDYFDQCNNITSHSVMQQSSSWVALSMECC